MSPPPVTLPRPAHAREYNFLDIELKYGILQVRLLKNHFNGLVGVGHAVAIGYGINTLFTVFGVVGILVYPFEN